MEVRLISWPSMGAVELCEHAAAMCTQSDKPARALRHALRSGHDSVLEHACFTFEITGISRVTLAQLTRHRIASFSVMSQRYVNQTGQKVIIPKSILDNGSMGKFVSMVEHVHALYDEMVSTGIPDEDARYILPQGITTKLLMTMNARELGHFFSLRCCNRAQAEIRILADKMLAIMVAEYPELFGDAGPACVRGACHEAKPCGHPRVKNEWRDMLSVGSDTDRDQYKDGDT